MAELQRVLKNFDNEGEPEPILAERDWAAIISIVLVLGTLGLTFYSYLIGVEIKELAYLYGYVSAIVSVFITNRMVKK